MNPPFEYDSNVITFIRDNPFEFIGVIIVALVLAIYVNRRIG